VCGVVAIVHYLRKKNGNGVFLENVERQGILVSYQGKFEMGVAT
jgi:hypothetical protein